MTKEEISALWAGIPLDIIIHKKLLCKESSNIPSYSTDLNCTQEIIMYMEKQYRHMVVKLYKNNAHDVSYGVSFRNNLNRYTHTALSNNLAEAICKAALMIKFSCNPLPSREPTEKDYFQKYPATRKQKTFIKNLVKENGLALIKDVEELNKYDADVIISSLAKTKPTTSKRKEHFDKLVSSSNI